MKINVEKLYKMEGQPNAQVQPNNFFITIDYELFETMVKALDHAKQIMEVPKLGARPKNASVGYSAESLWLQRYIEE